VVGINYVRSFNTLTIKFSSKNTGLVVDVYNTGPDTVDEADQLIKKNLVAENITSEKKLRLKKGSYSVVSRKNDAYEQFNKKISLYQGSQEITVESFFSQSNLDKLLAGEKSVIEASLISKYPRIKGQYIFENESLFHFGDWYGTTLKYVSTDSNNSDTLVAVLKKEGNVWKVITRPPNLFVSTKDHPEIPLDIANELNQKVY
jgi:hypothetical protein